MSRLLVVDDEPGVLYMLKEVLSASGHDVIAVPSAKEALSHAQNVDAVVSDLAMPGTDGLAFLQTLRAQQNNTPFVLITAHGDERVAVRAMQSGAQDYLTKPLDIDELRIVVERVVEQDRLRREVKRMRAERAVGRRLVAESAGMRRLLDAVERVADKDVTVLVRGETGTGKELVAAMLHAQSRRVQKPFVRFNCAALAPELADAELFGHAKGAFTGAVGARKGFFAEADGGTLVLDEVGELPMALQPKILRALQEGEIQPVGGRIEKVNVRVVACTHRDLALEVAEGRFREDLYYRLAVVELAVPALRERRDEIPALALELAKRYAERFDLGEVSLSPQLVLELARADWPGNVRQLENTVARMLAFGGAHLDVESFHPERGSVPDEPISVALEPISDSDLPLRVQVDAFERALVLRALSQCEGNQSHAAKRLGIGRATLIDKMKRYAIR